MKVFRGLPNLESRRPCALTIGNFDGVHRGHQALLAELRAAADRLNLPVCVMTFEPHPREFFQPASAPTRVANLRDKLEGLRACGVDRVIVEHFSARFASLTATQFIQNIVVDGTSRRPQPYSNFILCSLVSKDVALFRIVHKTRIFRFS